LKILRRIVGVKNQAIIATKAATTKAQNRVVPFVSSLLCLLWFAGDETRFARIYMPAGDLEQNSNNWRCVHSKAAALRVILASPFPHRTALALNVVFGFRRVA
jgi:hypothetical protein